MGNCESRNSKFLKTSGGVKAHDAIQDRPNTKLAKLLKKFDATRERILSIQRDYPKSDLYKNQDRAFFFF